MLDDLAWIIGAIVVCGGLYWLAYRIEPHWVAKDGSRFITTAQTVEHGGQPGPRREVRCAIMPDGRLTVSRRSMLRSRSSVWRLRAKSPAPPRGKEIYLLEPIPADPLAPLLVLRVPARSRVVPGLDALAPVAPPHDPSLKLMSPGTRKWAPRPDRG